MNRTPRPKHFFIFSLFILSLSIINTNALEATEETDSSDQPILHVSCQNGGHKFVIINETNEAFLMTYYINPMEMLEPNLESVHYRAEIPANATITLTPAQLHARGTESALLGNRGSFTILFPSDAWLNRRPGETGEHWTGVHTFNGAPSQRSSVKKLYAENGSWYLNIEWKEAAEASASYFQIRILSTKVHSAVKKELGNRRW